MRVVSSCRLWRHQNDNGVRLSRWKRVKSNEEASVAALPGVQKLERVWCIYEVEIKHGLDSLRAIRRWGEVFCQERRNLRDGNDLKSKGAKRENRLFSWKPKNAPFYENIFV